ncbi:MAG: biopolymer transporter ExbD [Deltaproteobacteria bacterium]|nr:biopolymer transporter ExbD [Deltaproteobacteria bacterium]
MALGKSKRRSRKFVHPKLMLTSMMDMFTIILIFLLFSFSDHPEDLKLDEDLELPTSTAKSDYQETIKIVLSQRELRLNDEVMAAVEGRQVAGLTNDNLENSPFFQRLNTLRIESEQSESSQAPPTHILFLCDKSHSFQTINRVIKTAGLAGYPNFQFAVLEE